MEYLTTMDDLDTEPTIEELSKTTTEMASWKASDSDGIPAGLFRQCKSNLLPFLHDIVVKVGEKARCHKTCMMLRLSFCIRTRMPDQIATTTQQLP